MTTRSLEHPKRCESCKSCVPESVRTMRLHYCDRPSGYRRRRVDCSVCARELPNSNHDDRLTACTFDDDKSFIACSVVCAEFASKLTATDLIVGPIAVRTALARARGGAVLAPMPDLFPCDLWSPIGTIRIKVGPENKRFALEVISRGSSYRFDGINSEEDVIEALQYMPNPYTATPINLRDITGRGRKLDRFATFAQFAIECGRAPWNVSEDGYAHVRSCQDLDDLWPAEFAFMKLYTNAVDMHYLANEILRR